MVDQRRFENQPSQFLEAKPAAKLLGVELRTLYAYASRGLVRSVRGARGLKRLYAVEDLERLKIRSGARAGHGAVAAGALRWGEPVFDSAITQITPRGPSYRGRLATELAAARRAVRERRRAAVVGVSAERADRLATPCAAARAARASSCPRTHAHST